MTSTNVAGFTVTCEESIIAAGVSLDTMVSCKAFTDWLGEIDRNQLNVRSVHIQSVNMFGERVGFMMFRADVVDRNDKPLPGVVFMRGGCVAILPVLVCNGKQYTVMTVQPRLPTGKFDFVEVPAGMLDGNGDFVGVAAKELGEELKMKVGRDELIDMSEMAGHVRGFFPTPGGSDETIRVYCFVRQVSQEELDELNGRLTGNLEEGEQITLKIMPLKELWKIPDGKTIVAYTLFRELEEFIL